MDKKKYNEIIFGAALGLICSMIGAFMLNGIQNAQIKRNVIRSVFEELCRNKASIELSTAVWNEHIPLETSAWDLSKPYWNQTSLPTGTKKTVTACYTLINLYNTKGFHTEINNDSLGKNSKYLIMMITKTLEEILNESNYLHKTSNQRVEPTVKTSGDSVNEQGTDTAHP